MATDPSSIIQGMLQSAGLGRTVSDFQQQDAQTQGMQLRNQAAQQQMTQEQAQAQRMQAFQTAMTSFGGDPSDGNLAKIALQFPEQVDTLKKQKQLLDAPVLNAHKTYFSGLERVAGAGNTKLVTQQLQSMITAEKAAGHDTAEAEDMLSAINANEPTALKQVQAFAKGQLYVIDPEYAAAVDKSHATDNANHYTSTGDGAIYDQRTGAITREAPEKPAKWRFDENSGSWLQEPGSGSTGGGGLVSSGPAAGNRGDVSRLINTDAGGGYLPDSVQTLGQFVGYGRAMNKSGAKSSSAGIYQINGTTMAEFGPKALGKDWKNAPFNAVTQDRVGKEIFNWAKSQPNPAAALRGRWVSLSPDAASQLVKGNWEQARGAIAQGETGGAPGASANAGSGNPGVVKVLPGKAKPQRMNDQEVQAEGLDPNTVYYRDANGVPQAVSGQRASNAQYKPVPQVVVDKIKPIIDARDALERSVGGFKKDYGGHTFLGSMSNTIQGITGVGAAGQRDWWADFNSTDNQIRNSLFGASLTPGEKNAYESTTVAPNMAPAQIEKNLKRRYAIVKAALTRQTKFLKANKYDPEAVDVLVSPLGDYMGGGQQRAPQQQRAAAPSGFRILSVRPK